MDWGKGILLAIIGFVIIIITMVVISVRMDGIELVTENYYEEEIKFQDQIDKENSTLKLNREVMNYDPLSKTLQVNLPPGAIGKLQLFRPSDSNLDQNMNFTSNEDGLTSISMSDLKTGYWKFQLNWTEEGKDYYQEKKIDL
jgi:hypothetical protein